MNTLKKISSFIILLAFFILPGSAHAQQSLGQDPLVIEVTPKVPAPGDTTTITLTSTPVDLSRSTFVWKVNGAPKDSGAGKRSFTFTMGASSQSTIISVTITPPSGDTISRVFTFHPGSVSLLWEANTYTPPFYKGRALYTPGADVRIVAIPDIKDPNGTPVSSSRLTYKWSVDEEAFADRSGLGRNTFYLAGAQLQPDQVVAVDVLRENGIRAAHAELVIPKSSPMVRFYKSDPLRGVLYKGAYTDSVRLTDTETTLQAEPYFISGTTRESALVIYTWTLNNNTIEPQSADRSAVTLRQTVGQSGYATLSLQVQNADLRRLLQHASEELKIFFGN